MSETETTGRRVRVAVLMGGNSAERDVSLSTGRMILRALDPEKYLVTAIDTQDLLALSSNPPRVIESEEETSLPETTDSVAAQGDIALLPAPLSGKPIAHSDEAGGRPDVVFIALHGKGGEDGAVQGMLEMLGLPYTGSGVLASALAMDKSMSKRIFREAGIPIIEDIVVRRGQTGTPEQHTEEITQKLGGFPVFVKPNAEGSTFGCTLVKSAESLPAALENALRYDPVALIERYVRGMEITAGILENPDGTLQMLPLIEIVPQGEYYDYESKYAEGGSEHIIPARLSEALTHEAQQIARRCHDVLGCRGMSRTDMLVADDRIFVLETNTIPGMTPTSLLPHAAATTGIRFSDLLDRLIDVALKRTAAS